MANLLLYCGSCRKAVAVVGNKDKTFAFGTTGNCPRCGKPAIQNGFAVLRNPVEDECYIVKAKPVTKTIPKATPKPKKIEEVDKKVQVDGMKGLIDQKPAPKKENITKAIPVQIIEHPTQTVRRPTMTKNLRRKK